MNPPLPYEPTANDVGHLSLILYESLAHVRPVYLLLQLHRKL